MDLNPEQRHVLKFFWYMGRPAQQTYQEMKEVYKDDFLGQSTILCWHNFFTKGWESAALGPHSGRPASIVTEMNINIVVAIIRDDHHMSVRMLESMVRISKSSIHHILSEHLQIMDVALSHVRANGATCGSGKRMGTESPKGS